MAMIKLPTKKELLENILSDAATREEQDPVAWEAAIAWELTGVKDDSLEEILADESFLKNEMYAYIQGYNKENEKR